MHDLAHQQYTNYQKGNKVKNTGVREPKKVLDWVGSVNCRRLIDLTGAFVVWAVLGLKPQALKP